MSAVPGNEEPALLREDREGVATLTLNAVLDQMIDRCRALKLRAPGRDYELRQKIIRLISRKVAHSLYRASRRQWFAL